MNKLLAQTIDRLAIDILSPRFNASEAFTGRNRLLLESPPIPPKRIIKTPKLFLKRVKVKGSIDIYDYAFPSRVETPHVKNNTVYGRYYKLNNGAPKSTVILLHGIFESRHWYQEKHALNIVKSGHNCLIMTLPYHVERAAKGQSGSQFISTDLKSIFEALQQGMKDVMALINWLVANGEKKIGLMGVSLGGLVAGLVASASRRINYLVLLAPSTTPLQITGYVRAGRVMDNRVKSTGLSKDQLFELFDPWRLLYHKPHVVPSDRTFIINAVHENALPDDSVENVWGAWGKPRISRYEHGNLSILTTRRVFRDISTFLGEAFTPRKSAGLSK
ncbi:MAG TPA: YqiA/YcfP family alpha/beta fold hydrolase [Anaerolineae bacterium]|nr:YqiA/YcfP family alpha/beta fold hydrolase [Anaerolineae bacterium]